MIWDVDIFVELLLGYLIGVLVGSITNRISDRETRNARDQRVRESERQDRYRW